MSHAAFAPSARLVLPRLLLLKSDAKHHGKFMHSGKHALYGNPPRWHAVTADKPAPKGAPVAAHPMAAGSFSPAQHFTDEQWAALKLPDSNVNAPSYNKALDKLKAWSDAGSVTAIVGAGFGSNTYGQKLAKVANHLLGLHGSAHKVVAGQKAGEHTAVQSGPTDAHPSGLPEHLAPKTTPGLQEPGGMSPLAQHVKDSLDQKAADGDVEFIKLVAANNPEHPQIVAYAQQKLAELDAKAPALPDLDSPEDMAANYKPAAKNPLTGSNAFKHIGSGDDAAGKAGAQKAAKEWLAANPGSEVAVASALSDMGYPDLAEQFKPAKDTAPSLPPGAKLSTNVNAVPLVHTTTPEAAAAIQKDGFKPSKNSMYGKGVYFSSAAQSGAYGSAVLGAKLKPHKQLVLSKDSDVSKAFTALTGLSSGHLGSDKGAKAMIDAGVGSMVFPVDGETYTVVFDPGLIDVQTNATSGPLTMPAFDEGKTTTGVKALYEKTAQKIIDHAHAGNAQVVQDAAEPHKKMWHGKTANSKKLLALHAAAMAHASGGSGAAPKAPLEQQMDDKSIPLPSGIKTKIDAMDASDLSALVATHSGPGGFKKILAYAQAKLAAKQAPATGEKPADAAAGPTPLASFDGAGDMVAEVHKNPKGFAVVLKDKDSGESLPSITIYPTKEWATSSAENLAAGKPAPKEGDTKPGADGKSLVFKDGRWHKHVDADEHGELPPVLVPVSDPAPAAAAWNALTTDQKASILAVVSPLYTTGYTGKPNAAAKKMAAAGWGALTDQVKSKVTPYISMHAHAKQEAAAKPAPVMPEKPVAAEPAADKDQSPLKTIGGITFEAVKSGAVWKVKVAGTDKLIDGIYSDSKGGLWSKLNQHHGSVGVDSFASEFGGKTETPLSPQQIQNLQSIPWFKLKLPAENTNAKSHNAAVAKIEAMAFAGDTAGLQAFIDAKGGAKQTYAKKQVLLAQTALAGLQVQGATAAVPVEPAPAAAPAPAASDKITSLTRKQVAGLQNWLKVGQPTSKHPDSWSNLWKKLSSNMKAAVKAEMDTSSPATTVPSAHPPVTADTPLTQGQKDAVDGMSLDDLHVLAGDGQPLPPNVKVAVKKKLAEKQAAATPKPVQAPKTILHNTLPGHSKSWSVYVAPNASGGFDMVTEHGKIGGTQQKTVKSYPTHAQAGDAAAALKNTKFKKGYVQQPTDYDHTVPAPGTAAQPAPAAPTGPVALDAGKLDALKASVKGHSNSEFLKTLKPAALSGDTAAIQKWKAANAGKLPNTQKLADKILAAMGGPKEGDTKQGADGLLVLKNGHWVKMDTGDDGPGDWAFSANDPAFSGANTIGNHEVLMAFSPGDGAELHTSASMEAGYGEPELQAHTVHELVQKMATAGHSVPPLSMLKKLDPGYEPPAAAAPPAPAAKPAASNLPSMDAWTKLSDQKGSNPGGKFRDASGQEWYCKWPSDPDAIASEVLAAKLYALAGLSSQDCMVVNKGGKPAIATKWVNIKKAGTAASLAKTPGALDGFAVDAWLGNWDVVGQTLDNLQVGPDGKAHRVDAGGSLEYRAQGEKKPFGASVTEIDTLRDASKNEKAAAVFGKMTAADITASVAKVLAIDDASIRAMVAEHGPGDEAARKALADTLIARKADLFKRYPKAAKPGAKKPLDRSALPIDPKTIPKPHDFENWNGAGKGLSSKVAINQANASDEYAMLALAQAGNLTALKTFQFTQVSKDTGAPTGAKLPISQHPSKHVVQYHSDLVQLLDEVANPPEPLKAFRTTDVGTVAGLSAAFPPKPFGTTVSKVSSNEKLGFWVALGAITGISKFKPKATHDYSTAAVHAAKEKYKTASALAKHFISSVQASGSYNDLFRDGKTTDGAGNKLTDVAKAALAHATEMPEGTSLYRWQKISPQMLSHIMSAKEGTVFQATGPMCTSYHPTATKNFGAHRVKIRYAKGAKAVESFASGAFGGEKEVTTLPNARFVILSKQMVPDVEHGKPGAQRLELEILMLPPDLGIKE